MRRTLFPDTSWSSQPSRRWVLYKWRYLYSREHSLRSRRLEEVGTRKNGRARRRHARRGPQEMELELLKGRWNNLSVHHCCIFGRIVHIVPDWYYFTLYTVYMEKMRPPDRSVKEPIAAWQWDFVQRKANKPKSLSCQKMVLELLKRRWGVSIAGDVSRGGAAKSVEKRMFSQASIPHRQFLLAPTLPLNYPYIGTFHLVSGISGVATIKIYSWKTQCSPFRESIFLAMAWPEKEKKNVVLCDNALITWRSEATKIRVAATCPASNEGKNPSPVESQFYDLQG